MCGIGGYVGSGPAIDEEVLLNQLAHRGPDGRGRLRTTTPCGAPLLLAFTRLAILDLSEAGSQPMSSEDGAVTLVYNGETYNFAALREELAARGHRFRSTSDSEVVLRGYIEWGEEVLPRMRGMFALALFDRKRRLVLLARDRLGIKPLYYAHDGRRLVFSSELRALLRSGAAAPRLDARALHGFLALGSVPQPRTLIAGVSMLRPGHLLTAKIESGRPAPPELRRYHSLLPALPSAHAGGAAAGRAPLAEVLAETAALHLLSDVPLGVLLSGGMDSTAVAILASQAGKERLASFTLSYGAGVAESEGAEARRVADGLGTRHFEEIETEASLLAAVPGYLSAIDQPSVDGMNTYLVARLVRGAGYKVVLSGLGGDEVFSGYALSHRFARLFALGGIVERSAGPAGVVALRSAWRRVLRDERWDLFPPALVKALSLPFSVAAPGPARARSLYAALRALMPWPHLSRLLSPELGLAGLDPGSHIESEIGEEQLAGLAPHDIFSCLELENYLSNTLLRDADVMAMAHGVELRVPLCDHVLIEAVLRMGSRARLVRGRKKPLLTEALPHPLLTRSERRRKRGFVLPLGGWLGGALRGQVDAHLRDEPLCRALGLSPAPVSGLWRRYLRGGAPGATWRIFALFTLLGWAQKHKVLL